MELIMKNKKTEYGNITLGKINKMLISFIGESTFYYYCEEFAKEGLIENWQSKDAFQRYINRLFAEEDSDFAGLNVANNSSIPVIVCKILDKFVSDYGCMPILVEQIKKLAFDFYTGYREFKYPIYETYNFYRAMFCENYEEYAKKMIATIVKEPRNLWLVTLYFCTSVKKYNFAYDFVSKLPDFGSKEELYRKLADYYQDKEKQTEHYKQIITNQMKDSLNPKWINMKEILDYLMLNEAQGMAASWLIEAYLLSNIEKFIRKESGIPEEQVNNLLSVGENVYSVPPNLDEFLRILKELEFDGMDKKKFDDSVETINKALNAVFNEHIYLHDENQTKEFIENVRIAMPDAANFYCTWMEGYIQLAKDNILGAMKKYKDAFEYRRFAGYQFENFIKQAFALYVFASSTDIMVREAVDPSKNRTTPLKNEAKKFWNYGYALEIFKKPAEDTFIEIVYKTNNFLSVFDESMFFSDSKIKKTLSNSLMKDIGIDCMEFPDESSAEEEFKKEVEKDYERLSKLTNENINIRVRMYNHDVQPAVPPLTLAIYHAENWSDERFILLIKKWLGLGEANGYESINVNSVSDKGTTPLQASLRAYKESKTRNNLGFAREFKLISLAIIEKSTVESFTVKSVKTKREVLQEAIESSDLDLVKAIIEKGLDVNGLLISSDNVSPVYYCIQEIIKAKFPSKFLERLFKSDESINMVWENLNMPGLTNADKKENYEKYQRKFFDNAEGQKYFSECLHELKNIPKERNEVQISNLREICLYLIDKTASQDEFIKENPQINQKWTSLFYAAETDDKEVCRALLENGANPNLHLGYLPEWGAVTFLKTCVAFESWDVLEMFLSEYSDLAKLTINESDNIYQASSFAVFMKKMIETRQFKPENYKGRDFVLKMANLFGQCGASYNQPSMFGSANDMLKFI